MAKIKVFWRDDECKLLADYLFDLDITPKSSKFLYSIKEAQKKLLPVERQRYIVNRHNVQSVIDVMEKVIEERQIAYITKGVVPPLKQEAPVDVAPLVPQELTVEKEEITDEVAEEADEVVHKAKRVTRTAPAHAEGHLSNSMDTLLEALACEMADRFAYHLKEALSGIADREVAMYLGTTRVKKERKPRVIVVGLIQQQSSMINEEFKDSLDLRFVETNTSRSELSGKIQHADAVIGMVGFMNHSIAAMCEKHANYTRISGGMDSLRSKLLGFVVGAAH